MQFSLVLFLSIQFSEYLVLVIWLLFGDLSYGLNVRAFSLGRLPFINYQPLLGMPAYDPGTYPLILLKC